MKIRFCRPAVPEIDLTCFNVLLVLSTYSRLSYVLSPIAAGENSTVWIN